MCIRDRLKGNDGCWYAVLRYDQNYIKQKEEAGADPVSYTHLDVYKRQIW